MLVAASDDFSWCKSRSNGWLHWQYWIETWEILLCAMFQFSKVQFKFKSLGFLLMLSTCYSEYAISPKTGTESESEHHDGSGKLLYSCGDARTNLVEFVETYPLWIPSLRIQWICHGHVYHIFLHGRCCNVDIRMEFDSQWSLTKFDSLNLWQGCGYASTAGNSVTWNGFQGI